MNRRSEVGMSAESADVGVGFGAVRMQSRPAHGAPLMQRMLCHGCWRRPYRLVSSGGAFCPRGTRWEVSGFT